MLQTTLSIVRMLTGRGGRLPDFLGIGTQRGGTTTLYDRLRTHPDLYLPEKKEIHYFSRNFDQPLGWYTAHFANARRTQRTGEVTPYYLFHPEAPQRIAALRPQVRLIVLLRDPVERALSAYFRCRRRDLESLELEAAFAAEHDRLADAERTIATPGGRHLSHQEHSYLARSRYEEQLARYQAHFPRSQMLILRSEDFFAEPETAWRQIQEFLDVRVLPLGDTSQWRNQGRGESAGVSPAFRAELRRRLQPTYDAMRRDYAIEWPEPDAGDARVAR
jgi:hypothetical protein